MKNVTKLPCPEVDFINYKWTIILVKPEQFATTKIKKVNIERLDIAIAVQKEVVKNQNPAGDKLTVTSLSVRGKWNPLLTTNPEAQLPVIKNPGRFKSDSTWSEPKRSQEKELYSQEQEQ